MSTRTAEFQHLLELSALVGADPALVQAAGGNTSIKEKGTLWIKASGTWLMNALTAEIMVPVALSPLLQAMDENNPLAERSESFVLKDQNPGGLRPSIETTVHAALPQKIVVHVHCVETIAIAARHDAVTVLATLLDDFNWRYVPYVRPGLPLSRSIVKSLHDDHNTPADVIILGNHGLVVAAESVTDVQRLLSRVCSALKQPVRQALPADQNKLERLVAGYDYQLPVDAEAHHVALDDISLQVASAGSLYPDHVIFLGEGSVLALKNETPAQVAQRCVKADQAEPVSILFPGIGVVMKNGCSSGAQALARCLSDVCARIPSTTAVNYLTAAQNYELLHWDAEQYRQTLNTPDHTKENNHLNG